MLQTVELLMEWACMAESVLRSVNAEEELAPESTAYLEQKLTYDDKKLLDANGEAVMSCALSLLK